VCPLWARQFADAFNQPLSFDTSSVTDMGYMFHVRFRLRLLPTFPSCVGHTHAARAADSPFPLCHISVPRVSLFRVPPFVWTRQGAAVFNQPLSFHTCSVTEMYAMFEVRFYACAFCPLWISHARWVTLCCLR